MFRRVKWLLYRIKCGFWPCDLWDLDYAIVRFALPRLKGFRKGNCSYPAGIEYGGKVGAEAWSLVLSEIIWAFEHYKNTDGEEELRRMEEGVRLFGEYFFSLWW